MIAPEILEEASRLANKTQVTETTFDGEVKQAELPVLVDFWADWCAPCRMLDPVLEELAQEYAGRLKVVGVDVDANPNLAGEYGVMSIPTVMLFKDGEVAARLVGYRPKSELKKELEPNLV